MSTPEVTGGEPVKETVEDIEDRRALVTSILARLDAGGASLPSSQPHLEEPVKERRASKPAAAPSKEAADTERKSPTTADSIEHESDKRKIDTFRPHVLPADFEPSPVHVLCGRRKGHKDFGGNWSGNLALQEMIKESIAEFERAGKNESLKEEVIFHILSRVRKQGGGFVRKSILLDDDKNQQQRWMDVGDMNARKDVAAIFNLFVQAYSQQHVGTVSVRQALQSNSDTATPSTTSALPGKPNLSGFTIPNVPTKLNAVEDAKRHGLDFEEDKLTRRRSTASIENNRKPATQKTAKILERELWSNASAAPSRTMADKEKEIHESTRKFLTSMHEIVSSGSAGMNALPMQLEPPKKRRSIDEDIAADALQMIAHAASAADDDSTANTAPTQRRRSAIKVPMARPALAREDGRQESDVRVCCLQLDHRREHETPWDSAGRALACLKSVAECEQNIDIFILPELCPFGSNKETFTKYLPLSDDWQSLYNQIDEGFKQQAREVGAYIVYGMIGWYRRESDRSLRFTLQHKVVDKQGSIVAVYDKCHLSDLEMKFFEAGPRKAVTFSIEGFTFGLLVGDDLKYPGLARSLARDKGVDVLVHPSAEETPQYVRRCRAVENAVYVLGIEDTNGSTVAVPPDPEHEPVFMEKRDKQEEGYLLTRIQRVALDYARTNFSYYRVMMTEPKKPF